MTIRTAHLCAGYDGLGLALDMVHPGHEPQWFAENDPDVSLILKRERPDVRNVGDIKSVPWHLSPHIDLLTSGDPCQSISIAGRQAGRDDPRFLWPWVRQAIAALRPFRVFLENVQNMASHDGGRTLRERLDDLRALGYASRWTVLGACAVGAPHHRHRWFLVADLVEHGPAPEAVRIDPRAVCGAPRSGGRPLLPTPLARDAGGRGEGTQAYWDARGKAMPLAAAATLLPTPRATDGPNGGPNQRNGRGEYDALPGVVVNLLPTPTALPYGNNQGGAAGRVGPIRHSLNDIHKALPDTGVWGKYADAVALWEAVTDSRVPPATEPNTTGGRRLSPLLPEWMMGLPRGYLTADLGRSAAIRAAGNGVVPLQAAAAYRRLT